MRTALETKQPRSSRCGCRVVLMLVSLVLVGMWCARLPYTVTKMLLRYMLCEEWSGHDHDFYVRWYRRLGPEAQSDLIEIAHSHQVPSYNRGLAVWTYRQLAADNAHIEKVLMCLLHSPDEGHVFVEAVNGLHDRLTAEEFASMVKRHFAAMRPKGRTGMLDSLAGYGDSELLFRTKLDVIRISSEWSDGSWAATYHLVREHVASPDILPFVVDLHIESPFFPMMKERNLFPHEWEALVEWMKHFDERYVIQRHPEQPSWTIERR